MAAASRRDDGGNLRVGAAEFQCLHDDAFGDVIDGGGNVLREGGREGGAFGVRSRAGGILDERLQGEGGLHDRFVIGFLQVGDEFLDAFLAEFLEFDDDFLSVCGIGPFKLGGQFHGALRGDGCSGAGG